MRQPMSTSTKNEGRTVTSQLIPIASNSSIKSFAAAAAVVEQKLLQKQNSKISNNSNREGGELGPPLPPKDLSRQSMAVKLRNRHLSSENLGKKMMI